MVRASRLFDFAGGFVAFCALSGFAFALTGCSEEPTAVAPRELKIAANDGAAKDSFGAAVAISGDTSIVGAVLDDDMGVDSGSAYVFVRSEDGSWTQQAKLMAPDGDAGDLFGSAVAIFGDTVLVGAPSAKDNGVTTGAVHVFVRNGETWTHQKKLVPLAAAADDQFGYALGLDGDVAIIGAPADDEAAPDAGAAYFYNRSGTTWAEPMKLIASSPGEAGFFGVSVAIAKSTALVGAWDDGSAKNAGAVFVYANDGMSWTNQSTLVPTDPSNEDLFGFSVALSGDRALIGASGGDDRGTDSGAAYLFVRNGTTWAQDQKLLPTDGAAGDVFGYSVAIWDDLATIGAYWDDDRGDYSGAAYTFSLTDGNWVEQDKHAPSDGIEGQKFGCSVALDGDMAIAGAYGDNEKGAESGSAYVFSVIDAAP